MKEREKLLRSLFVELEKLCARALDEGWAEARPGSRSKALENSQRCLLILQIIQDIKVALRLRLSLFEAPWRCENLTFKSIQKTLCDELRNAYDFCQQLSDRYSTDLVGGDFDRQKILALHERLSTISMKRGFSTGPLVGAASKHQVSVTYAEAAGVAGEAAATPAVGVAEIYNATFKGSAVKFFKSTTFENLLNNVLKVLDSLSKYESITTCSDLKISVREHSPWYFSESPNCSVTPLTREKIRFLLAIDTKIRHDVRYPPGVKAGRLFFNFIDTLVTEKERPGRNADIEQLKMSSLIKAANYIVSVDRKGNLSVNNNAVDQIGQSSNKLSTEHLACLLGKIWRTIFKHMQTNKQMVNKLLLWMMIAGYPWLWQEKSAAQLSAAEAEQKSLKDYVSDSEMIFYQVLAAAMLPSPDAAGGRYTLEACNALCQHPDFTPRTFVVFYDYLYNKGGAKMESLFPKNLALPYVLLHQLISLADQTLQAMKVEKKLPAAIADTSQVDSLARVGELFLLSAMHCLPLDGKSVPAVFGVFLQSASMYFSYYNMRRAETISPQIKNRRDPARLNESALRHLCSWASINDFTVTDPIAVAYVGLAYEALKLPKEERYNTSWRALSGEQIKKFGFCVFEWFVQPRLGKEKTADLMGSWIEKLNLRFPDAFPAVAAAASASAANDVAFRKR